MIDRSHAQLSLVRQCALLGVSRSGLYYRPKPENEANPALMRLIDAIYTAHPFMGSRQITRELRRQGHPVNRKRVSRLMGLMGLAAVAPGPHTSRPHPQHPKYPYLLRNKVIDRPNQVWSTDITYVPMAKGHLYLVAILDWYSRRVLAWRVSNTLDSEFCVAALQEALARYGRPEIFNTDQGAQFTADAFTSVLKTHGIAISMDGKGRALDNVFVERLWRTVKYEHIYLNPAESGTALKQGLATYFAWYNQKRLHSSLNDQTPDEVYFQAITPQQAA
jgi:putative transposase